MKEFRKRYIWIVYAVFALCLVALLFEFEPTSLTILQKGELQAYDVLMNLKAGQAEPPSVMLVKIDDWTDRNLGWPIPRDQYGAVIALLSQAGAASIALDVPLPPSEKDSLQDARMVEYIATTENSLQVIGPYIPEEVSASRQDVDSSAFRSVGRFGYVAGPAHSFMRAPFINDYPFEELADVTTDVGHILLQPDRLDGHIRSLPLFVEYAGKLYPSLGFELAVRFLNLSRPSITFVRNDEGTLVRYGQHEIQADDRGNVTIDFSGGPEFFPSVSFYDILKAAQTRDEKFFGQFKGKVCIIGPTIRSLGDYYPMPVAKNAPGFTAHANVVEMFVHHRSTSAAPGWMQWILLIFFTGLVGWSSHRQSIRGGTLVLFLVTAAWLLFGVVAFVAFQTWFHMVAPVFSLLTCFGISISFRAATEGKQRKSIADMFGKYVDSGVVRELIDNPESFKLGGEKRELTLLFSDIKSFSSISEKLSDEVLVRLMNFYFTEMTNIIVKHRGTVDKYIGDAIMAFWGAPLADPDAPYRATMAALEMQRRLDRLQPQFLKISGMEVHQRVGVNTGICTVGNMGSERKVNYTAIGDAVNIASRLEGVNKQYGTTLLVSEMTFQKVSKKFHAREIDTVQVVGKDEPVKIYEILDPVENPLSEQKRNFLPVYAEALIAYHHRNWDDGIGYFEHALSFWPDDQVSILYIERMKLFKINPPGPSWNGVFVVGSK
jgi:adenylate cyclase